MEEICGTKESKRIKFELEVTIIPEEIWISIFEFFDFKTLQKVLTLVCSEWFRIIRQNLKFSSQLNVKPGTQLTDINSMLNSWTAIKVLQVEAEIQPQLKNLDLKSCPDLEKVLIQGNFHNDNFKWQCPDFLIPE